ncbi:MAG: flagellar basal body P-ring formation protein FlgA [Rhodobacteraceae bacterium]|jgi:flagella basal body P-ring formation protein FlgA|nr:flagellar basal body P-ring formation protein FlgA [Paracoccaceae bacterium]
MKLKLALLATLIAQTAAADILVPVRTIRPKEVLTAADLALKPGEVLGALSDPNDVIGQEARVALYPGRPVRAGDVGPPAIVERNDLVMLTFRRGGLTISAEGRALGRGAEGELIRVMNLASRSTVTGRIAADGSVEVK